MKKLLDLFDCIRIFGIRNGILYWRAGNKQGWMTKEQAERHLQDCKKDSSNLERYFKDPKYREYILQG